MEQMWYAKSEFHQAAINDAVLKCVNLIITLISNTSITSAHCQCCPSVTKYTVCKNILHHHVQQPAEISSNPQLDIHSVQRIYLRQPCFDASKPHVAASTGTQYQDVRYSRCNKILRCIYTSQNHASLLWQEPNTDFPDVIKFRLQCIRYGRKQSGSGIGTMIRIGLKSWSVCQRPDTYWHAKCDRNPCMHFWVILLTDRQTSRGIAFTSSIVGG